VSPTTLEDVAAEPACSRNFPERFGVDLQHGEGYPHPSGIGEAQVDLAEVATLRRLCGNPGPGCAIRGDPEIKGVDDQLAAVAEQRPHSVEEGRKVAQPSDLVETVADREHGVEGAVVEVVGYITGPPPGPGWASSRACFRNWRNRALKAIR
jgi:hypothetical protein